MPLVNFSLVKGRSEKDIQLILDTCHNVFVEVLQIPEGDRYQVVRQYDSNELIMADTNLGFERSKDRVLMSIVSRPRKSAEKILLYKRLQVELEKVVKLDPRDLMIHFVINSDEDWSFGYGEAQFLTGDL
ncbi:MAG: tautomerase family protein [Vagococcus sp.]